MEHGMDLCLAVYYLSGAAPLATAWRFHRHTSLRHALSWSFAAWLAWALVLVGEASGVLESGGPLRFVALCLVGCAGVAVLGARRPGAGAWNFVVLGLLAVFLLSWAEGALAGGTVRLGGIRLVFLACTLAVGVLNYLPTRLAPAALLLATACGLELWSWAEPSTAWRSRGLVDALIGLVPWIAWAALRPSLEPATTFDRLWRDFRDYYGVVWAQRLREQFNNSAHHAGLPVVLTWSGLRALEAGKTPDEAAYSASLQTLRALLKRFGLGHEDGDG